MPPIPVGVMQTPALQVAPEGQGLQPPQCMASPWVGSTQEPSPHWVVPSGHIVWQVPALQTSVPLQVVLQSPQCDAFDATQLPPQESRPAVQTHWPIWHICPGPQAIAHVCWVWPTLPPQPDAPIATRSQAPMNRPQKRVSVCMPASVLESEYVRRSRPAGGRTTNAN
jgi:hypothetical protein